MLVEIDGAKTINFELINEQYGTEVAERIQEDVNHCVECEQDWKLEIIDETKNFITIAFATRSYSQVYEVSKKRKNIGEKYLIGRGDCKNLLELMNSFQ